MELYLDTADIAAVKRLSRILPLQGVTTNPSLVARSGTPIWQLLPALRDAMGGRGKLFAQVIAVHADEMVEEALKLSQEVTGLVIKIPVTNEGLAALKMLKSKGIPTLGTAVHAAGQGLLAALAGAEYVAPYVNRVDAQGGDGVGITRDLHQLLSLHAPHSQVLAASFRTPQQVMGCLLAGCSAITLPVDIAEQWVESPAVLAALETFRSDWMGAFGRTTL